MGEALRENEQYPKIFLVCPNPAILPPDECLPDLFHAGLDTNLVERRIGLNEEGFLRDIFLRTNIAFELYPKSIFLFNVNVNKLDGRAWLEFLRLVRRLSSRDDRPIRLGLMHDTKLLDDTPYRAVCSEELLIPLGGNSRDNISLLKSALRQHIDERRKFPRFLPKDLGVDVHVTCCVGGCMLCARVFDLSVGHFSCVFNGIPPAPESFDKMAMVILSVGMQEHEIQASFLLTRDLPLPGWAKPATMYVFSYDGPRQANPQLAKRINHLIFTWAQRDTQRQIDSRCAEHLALRQDLAGLRQSAV
jgi:hypothetical protein